MEMQTWEVVMASSSKTIEEFKRAIIQYRRLAAKDIIIIKADD